MLHTAGPPTVPGAPTGVAAVAGNASASVSWTAPASNGGAQITQYTVTSSPGGITATTTGATSATNVVVSGLTNGTAYTFTVTATNSVGTGAPSTASAPVTPIAPTVPGSPTAVTAVAGNAAATVSWLAPTSDGGSAITGYTVTAAPGGATATTTGSTSVVVGGLTNGTAYTFTVRATNSVGTGAPSAASAAVTPTAATVPGAPTSVIATPGNALATVSWTAPSSNGGAPITAYTVTASPGGATATSGGATSAVVGGLTNGTAYTFTVTATNSVGTGAASTPSAAVTPTAGSTPYAVVQKGESTLVGAVGSVNVSLPVAAKPGDLLIATAAVYPGTATSATTASSGFVPLGFSAGTSGHSGAAAWYEIATGGETSFTFSQPAASTNYSQFQVTEVSGLGTSVAQDGSTAWQSTASAVTGYTQTFGSVPATPGEFAFAFVETGNATAQITPSGWSLIEAPTESNDSMARYFQSAGTTAPAITTSGLSPSGAYIAGMFLLRASAPTVPGAPTAVTAVAGNGAATVSWAAPASTGGSPITSYTVTASPGGATSTISGSTSAVVSGLTNGTAYTFVVTAANTVGTGAPSAPSAPVTPSAPTVPGAPTSVTAVAGNTSATVSWVAPANNGGSPITSYTVTATPGGATATISGATSAVVGGLTNGTAYTFVVTAANSVGTGAPSAPSAPVTPSAPTVPGAPTSVTAVAGNTSATVSWVAPASTGGSPITSYTVTASPGGATATISGATSAVVGGLTNGTAYTFVVTATNSVGTGAPSVASPPVTPSAPTSYTLVRRADVTLIGSTASVTVVFGAPAQAGDLLVATGGIYQGSAVSAVTGPAGFTAAGSTTGATGESGAVVWYKVAVGGETSFTFTQPAASTNYSEFAVAEISGLGASVAVDGVATWQSSATAVTTYTQTYGSVPLAPSELAFAFFVADNAATQVTPSGWTLLVGPSGSNDNMGYYLRLAGATAPSISPSGLSPAGGYTAGMIVFRSTS